MMSDGSLEDRRVLENVFGGLVCVPTPLKPHLEVIFPVALFVNQLSTVFPSWTEYLFSEVDLWPADAKINEVRFT